VKIQKPDIKKMVEKMTGFFKKIPVKIPEKFHPKNINLKDPVVKKRFIFISLIAVVVILVLAKTTSDLQKTLFKKKPEAQKAMVSFEEDAVPVKGFKIKRMDFKDTLPCIGNIKGFKEIDLKFQVAGVIESFNFEDGEKIQEGDIIASRVQKDALLKLKYSEVELNKIQKLYEIGAVNKMKMEQVKLEYESSKSELDKTNIYAMTNGLLGARSLDAGSYVTPNDKVGVFVNAEKVYAEFNIIEKDVPKIALGQKAEVYADAYPNKSFSGSIDRIAPIIEGRSRTEVTKVELDNKENLLKPGMFVRALIATYEKKDAIVVPASALKKKESEYFVYVVHKEEPKQEVKEKKPAEKSIFNLGAIFKKKDAKKEESAKSQAKEKEAEYGTIEVRKLKLGYMTQDLVEIAEGLKEDEIIVVEVSEEFKDKTRVEVAEMQEGLF